MTRTIALDLPGGEALPVFEAEPDGAPRGAVLVVQEAFGVNDHIEDVTRRFAGAGYRSVAPHLFHRSGDPRLPFELERAKPHMARLTRAGLRADLDATLAHLADVGFAQGAVAIVGFCMGGTVAFIEAAARPLGAAASFYGGGILAGRFGSPPLAELAPKLRTPWLGLYGDRDRGIPVEEVEALREAARRAPVPTEVVRYPEAGHGFHCDVRDAYHPPSAQDAWERTLAWFDASLAPRA
jgi:carboxymethylenebutenolidase